MFKWTDANGETHYSENAPTEQKSQEIQAPASSPADTSTNANQNKIMQEMEFSERARKANREAQEKAFAERQANEKKFRCAQAKRNISVLQQQVPIYTSGENGERNYLDDETRAAEIKKWSDLAAATCETQ